MRRWNESAVRRLEPERARSKRVKSAVRTHRNAQSVLVVLLVSLCAVFATSAADTRREQVGKIVVQIQRADYEGDRPALNVSTPISLLLSGIKSSPRAYFTGADSRSGAGR